MLGAGERQLDQMFLNFFSIILAVSQLPRFSLAQYPASEPFSSVSVPWTKKCYLLEPLFPIIYPTGLILLTGSNSS